MSNNQAAWEDPFAQEVANKLVLENVSIHNESDYDKVQHIIGRAVMKYANNYYPASVRLNQRVIALIDGYVEEYTQYPPIKTTAIPSGSSVFQGEAVQANLIGENDNGYIDGKYVPGKEKKWYDPARRLLGYTSKKPIATPVGGKTRRKRRSKRKTRRHRKKRA